MTTDPLYHRDYFAAAKPDFKKITTKAKKQQIELNVSYEQIIGQTKYVDFADLQLQDPGLFATILTEVFDMHAKGVIEPFISRVYPFQDANKALKFIQGRKCLGKVLVEFESKNSS